MFFLHFSSLSSISLEVIETENLLWNMQNWLRNWWRRIANSLAFAYGRSGFRSLCQMKKKKAFSKIQIAVALVDRENLMHSPLSFITRDYDRVVCWGFPKGTVSLDIEILLKFDRKTHKKIAKQKQLQEISPENAKLKESFKFVSSDIKLAKQFISDPKL